MLVTSYLIIDLPLLSLFFSKKKILIVFFLNLVGVSIKR